MSKQVEVPEGIKRWNPTLRRAVIEGHRVGEHAEMEDEDSGSYFAVSDLPAIYEHFSDRLLNGVVEALEREIGEIDEQIAACSDGGFPFTTAHAARQRLQNVLDVAQATSIPTTSDEEGR